MTHPLRKMTLSLAVTLLAAALLSSCSGSSKKGSSQENLQENAAELNKRLPGSYDYKSYEFDENGKRVLISVTEVDLDSKGRKIRENVRYDDDGSGYEKRWMYDDLDRQVFYWAESFGPEGEEYSSLLPVYDGDSDRELCQINLYTSLEGELQIIRECQYDQFGHTIFHKEFDSRYGDHYRVLYESNFQDGKRISYDYGKGEDYSEQIQSEEEWYYDENGRPIRVVVTDPSDGAYYEEVLEYDEQGHCVAELSRDDEGKVTSETRYKYNTAGVMIEEVYLRADNDGKMYCYREYLYDDQGRMIRETEFHDNGVVNTAFEYRWGVEDSSVPNRKVNIRTVMSKDSDGNLVPKYESFYLDGQESDSRSGNVGCFRVYEYVEKTVDGASDGALIRERETTVDSVFDSNGDIMKRMTYHYGWQTEIEEFDEHQNVVKVSKFDEDGKWIPEDSYEYEYTYY